MRWTVAALCVVTFALGVVILVAAPDIARLPRGGRAIPYLGVALAWGFVGVGSFAWLRRPDNRTGLLMAIVGCGFAISGLQLLDEPWPWVIGALCDTAIISVLFHLLLAFPSGRLEGRAERWIVAIGYTAGALQVPLVLFSQCDDGPDCPSNPLLIADNESVYAIANGVQIVLAVIAIFGTITLLVRRWRAATTAERNGLEPVLGWGGAICVLGLAMIVTQSMHTVGRVTQIVFISALTLLPAAFLLGLVRTRFFRTSTIARLIEQLSAGDRDLESALAEALHDPSLQVVYWLPERGYVDRQGHPVDAAAAPGLTEIEHEGRRVGALLHRTAMPELAAEAAAAAGLALENARLEVELRARLEALRASRARLVEAGDAERRRLGRDLHDGAQQRLVALMIELQLARERLPEDGAGALELVESAFGNAQAAVEELRDLASGIHPAVLSQRGLDAALESLASRAPVPVELGSRLSERLPIAVETAAYFVVAEALTNVAKYAQASFAAVDVERVDGYAVVSVRDDGVGGADVGGGSGLRGLQDRVGALDGTLEVSSPAGEGTLIRARIPLHG